MTSEDRAALAFEAAQLARRYMLALCVWREARGESDLGKALVAQVIENRVQDRRWPDDYVSVITQPWQFSAFNANDPNVTKFPVPDDKAWPSCVAAADLVLASAEPLTKANHYCVKGLSPKWADPAKVTEREGAHVFYCL